MPGAFGDPGLSPDETRMAGALLSAARVGEAGIELGPDWDAAMAAAVAAWIVARGGRALREALGEDRS